MEKKIIDITPPGKKRETIEELPLKREPAFKFKRPEFKISLPKFPFKKSLLVIPLILIIGGVVAFFNLSRAEIEIWPETTVLTFKTKLTIDKTVNKVYLLDKVIPGKVFDVEKTVSGEFSASGQSTESKKAEGTIRIYNNYHTLQVLVVNTRFQAPLEKFQPPLEEGENPWFRTVKRVVIPSKGYQDVGVIADNPGGKYNIEPATFSVPGLAGTPQYTFVYGKSFEPMKGGVLEETSQVTEEDLKGAKEELTQKAKEEGRTALKKKIPADFNFLEEASQIEILETSSLAQPGAAVEKFNYQVKAKSKALVFKTEDLKNFANEFILSQIPDNKKIHQESLKINYLVSLTDLEAGKAILSLSLESKIYSAIDEISLRRALGKKSSAETQFFLENQPQITRAKVQFWPFWVKRVPEEEEKIRIRINVDPVEEF